MFWATRKKVGRPIFILLVVVFLGWRFFHLEADFPAGVTREGALLTDEGWYGHAAAAYVLTGGWIVEGDFNPAISLPGLPLLQLLSFKTLGLSLASARLTVLLCLLFLIALLFFLVRKFSRTEIAWVALFLLAVNFPLFVYSRLALLEIPMTLFALLSLFLIVKSLEGRTTLWLFLAGLSLAAALLTKTSALFCLPVGLYVLWQSKAPVSRRIARTLLWCSVAGICLLVYYLLVVRTHWSDYQAYYLTNLVTKTHLAPGKFLYSLVRAIYHGKFIDLLLFPSVLISSLYFLRRASPLRANLLVKMCWLWLVTYVLMLSTQAYPGPRYYIPLVIPVVTLTAFYLDQFLAFRLPSLGGLIFSLVVLLSVTWNSLRLIGYSVTPKYSWMTMARDMKSRVEGDHPHPVLLGHFANSITLATGLVSINDRFGSRDLDYRIQTYSPNYYLGLGVIDPEIKNTLLKYYEIQKIRAYDVYDNYYTGQPVVLYKLMRK